MPMDREYGPMVGLRVDGFQLYCREHLDAKAIEACVHSLQSPARDGSQAAFDKRRLTLHSLRGGETQGYLRSFGGDSRDLSTQSPFMKTMRLLFSHRVERAGRHTLVLEQYGMHVPRVLCYGEDRRFGLLQRGLLITEWLPGDNLLDLYRDTGDDRLLRSAIQVLAELHHRGVTHGDPTLSHFLKCSKGLYLCDFTHSHSYNPTAQERDLLLFLSDLSRETRDPMLLQELLRYYENLAPRVLYDRHVVLRKVSNAA